MKTLKPIPIILFGLMLSICQAQIIHVPGDYPTIQEGIDAAQFFGDTVLVSDGEYIENINFNGKLITVASHFIIDGDTNHINNTIINGSDPEDPDIGSVVSFRNDEDSTSVLCGFTITGGNGTLISSDNIRTGGGILIENSNPKIIYNHIQENHISTNLKGSGGGIAVGDATNNDRLMIIRHNRISHNTVEGYAFAEGGGLSLYSNGIVEHNVITHNEISSETEHVVGGGVRCVGVLETRYIQFMGNNISHNEAFAGSMTTYGGAGGMQAYNCWGYIRNNTIQSNRIYGDMGSIAGGLHFGFCGVFMVVENNMITDNAANDGELGGIGGGIVMFTSNCQLINNVIARNYADNGSGVQIHYNYDGPAQFINNTIADNEGDGLGGAIFIDEAAAVVLNSILWENGNGSDEIYLENTADVEVAYSDVYGGWAGIGNIDEDPDFLDNTYHLQGGPCVDAGIGELSMMGIMVSAPDHDFDGQPRPLCGGYDLGADEALCEGIFDTYSNDQFHLKGTPNPSTGKIDLHYGLVNTDDVTIHISNLQGELLETIPHGTQTQGENTFRLDLSHLPNGLYFISLQAGELIETTKVILIK